MSKYITYKHENIMVKPVIMQKQYMVILKNPESGSHVLQAGFQLGI